MKIYTKTGDKGLTTLVGGSKVSKSDLQVEVYGTIDELNSSIGVIVAFLDKVSFTDEKLFLEKLQHKLLIVGGFYSSDFSPTTELSFQMPTVEEIDVEALEKEIDKIQEALPPLMNFILPGGSKASAFTHIARCTCRKVERLITSFSSIIISVEGGVDNSTSAANLIKHTVSSKWINRLSDYLFVLSRYFNEKEIV